MRINRKKLNVSVPCLVDMFGAVVVQGLLFVSAHALSRFWSLCWTCLEMMLFGVSCLLTHMFD